ncbi:SHOCT domain-containing protein [Arthrobacter sp. Bz4]|uniref:SHOCT domain-containing protein n=1 Tax=Arthrobacter sp. Bz4 TaxID=2171979 RepID=UPI000D51A154|nr:SHOCT domain-containing protein [Arthrobacter sp. Bz4]PVE19636.1 hypothetical protein DDA93_02485 [Arthrobacter sp. Bz4]
MPFGRQGRPGLLGSVARTAVISGTAQMTAAAINHRMHDRQVRPHPASSPPPPMTGGDQLVDQLARLANLHSAGVLTAAEFAAAKSRLLA